MNDRYITSFHSYIPNKEYNMFLTTVKLTDIVFCYRHPIRMFIAFIVRRKKNWNFQDLLNKIILTIIFDFSKHILSTYYLFNSKVEFFCILKMSLNKVS